MKQTCTLLLSAALLAGSSATAQLARTAQLPRAAAPGEIQHATPNSTNLGERDVVWSEDFSNGIAGNNPSGAWTLDGPDGAVWHFGTTAPLGAYTPASERIQSTTFNNGFAKFAGDSANCTWAGNTPTALPSDQFTDWDGSLVSPVIDLSATPAAILSFQQRARYCCGLMPDMIGISTDNGANWIEIPAYDNLDVNTLSATVTKELSLTGLIGGNPANVQIRFRHSGADNQTSHYHWQVDDVNISEAPATDGRVFDGWCSHRGDGTEHGRIPQNQLGGTMNLGGFLTNEGATPLTNATLTAVVTDNGTGTTQFTASTTTASLVPGDTLIMDEWPTFGTLDVGAYTVTFTGTSDEDAAEANPNNNGWVRTFQVTESGSGMTYSLDEIGGHPQGTQVLASVGTADFTDGADGLIVFSYYPVSEDLEVDAIEFVLASGSTAGGFYSVAIHDSTAILNDDPGSPLIESDEFDLTVSTGTVLVPLPEPITLGPGAYYASVTMFSNANEDDFAITDDNTIPQPAWSSGIFVQGQSWTNGTAVAIRLRNASVGLNETALEGVGIWPNPTDGLLNVTVREAGNYRVDVMNNLGQTVSSERLGGSSKLDLSGLAKGVYSVRVSTDAASMTQRVVLR